jgi:hypothetical protein
MLLCNERLETLTICLLIFCIPTSLFTRETYAIVIQEVMFLLYIKLLILILKKKKFVFILL